MSALSMKKFYVESPILKQTKSRYANLMSAASAIRPARREEAFPCFTLFKEFLECRKKLGGEGGIFLLIDEYAEQCCDHLKVLQDLENVGKGVERSEYEALTPTMQKLLKAERNTWRLMRAIFEDKLRSGKECDDAMEELPTKRMSDKDVIDQVFEKNSMIRTMQLVIDWLEKNERDDMDSEKYTDKIEFYSKGPHSWENTLHHIKNRLPSSRLLCQQMDPDAPIRSGYELHDLDKEDEARLMKHIFRYIRAGRLEAGKSIAEKFGYHWLSAALDGWILHHDFNFDEGLTDIESIPISQGNANRDLWKYTCFKYAEMKKSSHSAYEQAVFGVLSGNVKPASSLINRWSDRLWLLLRSSLDVHIENELRHSPALNIVTARPTGKLNYVRGTVDLPEDYWSNEKTFSRIFREVDALSKSDETSVEEVCHHTIQKHIILDDIDSTLDYMVDWSKETHDDVLRSHILRFCAHAVLFFDESGLITSDIRKNFSVIILEEYINYLIQWKEIELVASYVTFLPAPHQITTYSRLLETITDKDQRALCLKYAKSSNLDVESITKRVVEMIRMKPEVSEAKFDFAPLPSDSCAHTPEDKNKIEALDWLFIDEVQYLELLFQSNALLRQFALVFKKEAAKEILKKLPSNLIDGAIQNWRKKTGGKKLPASLENAIKEHLCHRSYISAVDSFDDWMNFYHSSKPSHPKQPTSNRFTDKVAYQHAVQQYEAELEHWKMFLSQQAHNTTEKIYSVLWFDDGSPNQNGWMKDQREEASSEEVELRKKQMKDLRKLVIPHLTFILHTVLHSSDRLKECLQIADVVASDTYSLYKEFTTSEMQSLLHKLRETSAILLDRGSDAFGYEVRHIEQSNVASIRSISKV